MDGFKKQLKGSVQFRLSFWLSAAILLVALIAGAFSFFNALSEAHELQDDILRQVAQLVEPNIEAVTSKKLSTDDSEEGTDVIVQRLADKSSGHLVLPPHLDNGLQTLQIGNDAYRLLVKTTAGGEQFAVAQAMSFRDEIARDGALRTLMPFLIIVPVLLLLVADIIRKLFRPIASLAVELDERKEQDLQAINVDPLPMEIQPFVNAINRLLDRVALSVITQRRFVADAAHELRSPLAALRLQAEHLGNTALSEQAQERLAVLKRGVDRATVLLEQLLALAKIQAAESGNVTSVSVQAVFRHVLEDMLVLAEAKQLDVGVEGTEDVDVLINEFDLFTMVKNLVSNAIRYTPEGGKIDLSVDVQGNQAVVQIVDNGPGIPVSERERVFDPFYRILEEEKTGSGLGLSIVKAIAERSSATVTLAFADEAHQCGLRVILSLPRA